MPVVAQRCFGFLALMAALSIAALVDAQEAAALVAGPLSPEDSLQHFKLLDGLRMELVASEPQVVDPVAVQFDENGRMWVVEMRDYPHGPVEGEEPRSMIKTLEDRDGDGVFEHVQVFADKLLFVTGVQPWRGGVVVTMAGEVAYMKDSDGDGRADVRETWYKGFAQENSQLRANHPQFGLDNHIYISNGLRGGSVVDARQPDSKVVALNGKDFRFDPTSFEFEALTGVGQFGLTFDDFGNRFVCSNRNPLIHIVLEDRYIARNPAYAPPAAIHDVAAAGEASRIYAISRAWTTSNLHAGQFTAACGCLIYRGNGMPERFYGNGFTCDPTGNLVHRELVGVKGATFSSQPAREGVEFLASPDEWFRPVNLSHGPDGALYVVDMYRAVIEHPQFMPDELKQRPDLALGTDRGRIYRITAQAKPDQFRWPNLGEATSSSLPTLLEHPNSWQRETAARLIYERQDKSAVEGLSRLITNGNIPQARVHALWALAGLGVLSDEQILAGLHDDDPSVRAQAIVLASAHVTDAPRLRKAIAKLAGDEFPQVRFHAALALAPVGDSDEVSALRSIVLADPRDVWSRRAVAIASGQRSVELLEGIVSQLPWGGRAAKPDEVDLIREFVTLATTSSEENAESRVLAALLDLPSNEQADRLRQIALQAFAEALPRRRSSLAVVLKNTAEPQKLEAVKAMFARAATVAKDTSQDPTDRMEAVKLLASDTNSHAEMVELALAEPVLAVRIEAINELSRSADPMPWQELLSKFAGHSPSIRRAVVNAALANETRTTMLLDAIETGQIKVAELEPAQVSRLLKHRNSQLSERAGKLLAAAIPEDRQKVLADYQVVLKMAADPKRGQPIFKNNCATCHRVGDVGVNVAPDISDSRTKQPAQILADVLQPNRAIDNNYVSYSVITVDGQALTGIISSDTATSITLRQPEDKTVTLLRTDIEEMRSNGISLMPEGLEKTIPPQDMADLISFIKNWRYLDGRTPLGGSGE
ncbi:MAG: HEAT repeat domain-containing protein [Planctomycetia bacterium]|nr:HEAT repeat domain-containing protein [Planctomycetia bacterium]